MTPIHDKILAALPANDFQVAKTVKSIMKNDYGAARVYAHRLMKSNEFRFKVRTIIDNAKVLTPNAKKL
jgi:hypothetical protein